MMNDVKPNNANVLSNRYASPEMATLWAPEHKIILERQLWIAVLKAVSYTHLTLPTNREV